MADHRIFRLRVIFCKQGRLSLLSHLEVARALERVVCRSGLPYSISQGFSPHMKIAFGAALPVGVGGVRECFDVQLERYIPPEEALGALQEASVPDLMVKSCAYIEPSAQAASVAFPVSTYRALLTCAPESLSFPECIVVMRKKKEKVLHVADFLAGDIRLDGAVLTFSLLAKPSGSLRPDVFLRSALETYERRQEGLSSLEDKKTLCVVVNSSPYVFSDKESSFGFDDVTLCQPSDALHVVSIMRLAQATEDGKPLS